MDPSVDTGKIIGVERFPMMQEETVESLSLKTYSALLTLYKNIMDHIINCDFYFTLLW